jgi:hypothetical protein
MSYENYKKKISLKAGMYWYVYPSADFRRIPNVKYYFTGYASKITQKKKK